MDVFLTITAVIVGLILLLIPLFHFGRVTLRIVYRDTVRVTVSVLGIPFTLFSSKQKSKKKRRALTACKNPDRVLARERRRQRRLARKAAKKRLRDERKKRKKGATASKSTAPAPNLKENLEMVFALIRRCHAEAQGQLRLTLRRMHLYVATEDAAKTAILYGVISQSLAYLLEWIDEHFVEVVQKEDSVVCVADFASQKTRADIDVRLSVRTKDGLLLAWRLYSIFSEEQTIAGDKALARQGTDSKANH